MKRHVISIIAILLSAGVGRVDSQGPARAAGAEPPPAVEAVWQDLLRQAAETSRKDAVQTRKAREETGVTLGPWQAIGPFKNAAFGIARQCFDTPFAPEKDVLGASFGPVDLSRSYEAVKFPGMLETKRAWQPHPEWIDGYRHLLPRGPAPSRNESCYLLRTIAAKRGVTLPAVLRTEDYARVWLNGERIAEVESSLGLYGWARVPKSYPLTLKLKAGENRLLVKFTSLHSAHGLAFQFPQLTGLTAPDEKDMAAVLSSTEDRFTPVNQPIASAGRTAQNEIFWERKDGIWEGLDVTTSTQAAVLYDRYAQSLLRTIGLPKESIRNLPQTKDAAGVETVRQLYHRARRFAAALARLRDFRFDVEPMPMYDPPQLRMYQMLEQNAPHSPQARGYLERLAALKPDIRKAVTAAERGEPSGAEAVVRGAGRLDALWRDECRRLPPTAFIRCPPFRYGGFGPYASDGAQPAGICLLDPGRPDEPPQMIFHEPDLRIYDMTLSDDARTLFFSARRNGVEGGWQIYEIGIDGRRLKQITRGESSNISPAELPSGEIVFVSTRSGSYAQCQPVHTGNLYVVHRDGSNVRKVSANIDSDHSPQVLNDGRVLFSRWDYGVEKNVFTRQALWAMKPDGTGLELFFGNTIEDPCSFWTAVPIPGRCEVVCVFGPHHGEQAGSVGLVWNRLGPEAPRGEGFRWLTRELPSQGDITFAHGYSRPYPVHECLFLVSYGGDGQARNRLYLLDDRGNRKCIYEDAELGCWNPLLVRAREVPPLVTPRCENMEFAYCDPEESNRGPDGGPQATLVVSDVYQGVSMHVARGEVQAIQIMEQVQKSRQRRPTTAWSTVSPIISRGTQHVRRLVGTVPVEADGSAHFLVSALKSISLNLLDREGRVLMTMGSDMHLMPGEQRSCVGCHETRRSDGLPPSGSAVGPPRPSWQTSLAARRASSAPQRPDWGTHGIVDFARVVQPVLDQHCVKCHSGPTPGGAIDLSGDRTRFFSMAYDSLIERGLVDWFSPFAQGVDENTPKMHGSLVSRLGRYFESDQHYGAKAPPEDRRRVYTWIDANVPYYGTYAYNKFREGSPGQRDGWDIGNERGWFRKQFQVAFERRCLACHQRVVDAQTAYYGVKLPVTSKLWTDRALNEHALWCAEQVLTFRIGPELRINLTHPEWSLALTAPLAKSAGGLA
ncbi:MAG: hypothetical protein ACLQNE_05950 [Thermoguttaceae bacterium]